MTGLPTPRYLVFDLGGVVVDWDPRHLYRKLIPDPAEMERFLATVCSPEWNAEQDRGRSFHTAVRQLAERHPHLDDLIGAFHTRWPEMLGGLMPGSAELLTELDHMGVPLFAITNWSAETFPLTVRRYPILTIFREIVVSGEVRCVKPDPTIFRIAQRRFDVPPAQCLFVDDAPVNVRAARASGMQAAHFTTAPALRLLLRRLGLPVGSGRKDLDDGR